MHIEPVVTLELLGYYALAYVISGILGAVILRVCMARLERLSDENGSPHYKQNSKKASEDNAHKLAGIVGIIERILYTSAILVGQPGFIGVWIVLKAVGEWRKPQEDTSSRVGVSNAFMINQIGTALSILVGVAAGYAIKATLPPFATLAPLHLPLS
jgi:hypothetical protein